MPTGLPIIDVRALLEGGDPRPAAEAIGRACREVGFFYVSGHGVKEALQERLEFESRAFFALPVEEKLRIAMARGGRAWRGYFPVGGELTSGKPDLKEGIYFGQELPSDHPLVQAGTPLHGPNLFPDAVPGLRATVLEYMAEVTRLGHALMSGIALSLGKDAAYFRVGCTKDPLVLFRIFNYPPDADDGVERWGVGEHTDYGVLTILKQDAAGGLQVRSGGRWVEAPPVPGTFVVNIGDMLERMTGGLYVSTPHRVRNPVKRDRLSFPLFFDPGFFAEVRAVEGLPRPPPGAGRDRWDGASVHEFRGTYGEYLLAKVSKVFPELGSKVL